MRPPVVKPGTQVTFTNEDALPGTPQTAAGLAQHHVLQGPL